MNQTAFCEQLYRELITVIGERSADSEYTDLLCRLRSRCIERYQDPLVRIEIGGRTALMQLSHQWPYYRALFPTYDTVLPRICKTIKQHSGQLKVIDVGANIGDSVYLILEQVPGEFLCIEGDADYFALLMHNTAMLEIPGMVCVHALCGEANEERKLAVAVQSGTGSVRPGLIDQQVWRLDSLLTHYPSYRDANILKIDTDGYDFKVLQGAVNWLQEAKPVLFFEYDPLLLRRQGDDPATVFPLLHHMGYVGGFLYTNFGVMATPFMTSDSNMIHTMVQRIDCQRVHYYDVLLIHEQQQELYQLFCRTEFQ